MSEQPGLLVATALPEAEALALVRRALGPQAATAAPRGVAGMRAQLTDRPGLEEAVWATIGKNQGLLALFAGGRPVATLAEPLGELIRVQPVRLPDLPVLAILVDDRYDALLGQFRREERRRIHIWDGRGLRQVLQAELLDEQLDHARWRNPKAPLLWHLHRTVGEVTLRDGLVVHSARDQLLQAPGSPQDPVPPLESFRLLSERPLERRFRWNARLRRFDPA